MHTPRDKRFKQIVGQLKKELPLLLPLRVHRRTLKKDTLGQASVKHDEQGNPVRFVICVSKELNWDLRIQILIHEYAHCLSWSNGKEEVSHHDEMWGIAYARVYREVMDEN